MYHSQQNPNGVPTDGTHRVVFCNISTDHFFQVTNGILLRTIDGIIGLSRKQNDIYEKRVVSVDGKISRGSGMKDSMEGKIKALQTLNVYSDNYGMCLTQKFINEKTNVIPAD